MGVYSDRLAREVRLERMRPDQIDAARRERAAIYLPFGALEWHGYHNPVGLDCLKAHEQLVGLAQRVGGVVYPPVYFGAGGGHTHAILLSGHYPNRSQYLDAAIAAHQDAGGTMRVLALLENQVEGIAGDHAAQYETSAMLYLDPSTVDMAQLERPPRDDFGPPDQVINYMGDEYAGHPCYGLLGIDPRPHASAAVGRAASERLIDYLAAWLDAA